MKKIIWVVFVASINLTNAQWSYLGLGSFQLTDLTIYNDTIYASTNDGIYKKNVFSADTTWFACGLLGKRVAQTLVADYQTFICVADTANTGINQIYKSIDYGNSFSSINSRIFTNPKPFLDHIVHPEDNYDTLYSLRNKQKTYNSGITWDTINVEDRGNLFIKVNPEYHAQLFMGGENMALRPFIQTSFDYGNNWTLLPNMHSFFSGDNAVHDMAFHGTDWFAVGEGVIGKTSDGGNSWDQLLDLWSYPTQWGLYILDIELSSADKNKIYATGNNSGVYRVPLLYSSDYGITWDTLSYNSNWKPDILCLAIKSTNGCDNVFLGGKGVYRYVNVFTDINDKEVSNPNQYYLSQNFPNPFNPITKINYTVPHTSFITIKIYNLFGSEITTLLNEKKPVGNYEIEFDGSNISSGVYFYRLTSEQNSITKKLILLK